MKRASTTRPRNVPKVESPANHLFISYCSLGGGAEGQPPLTEQQHCVTLSARGPSVSLDKLIILISKCCICEEDISRRRVQRIDVLPPGEGQDASILILANNHIISITAPFIKANVNLVVK
jgi:hypothetical protein